MKKLLFLFVPFLSSCSIITVPEYYQWPFNANSGDRVDVIMNPDGDINSRCDQMGGTLTYNADTWIFTCQGVDF